MELDSIELVMAVEETFQIETPNEAAEKLVTVGMLHDFIVTDLGID